MMVIIAEPDQEVQVFTDVIGLYQLPEWSCNAVVCAIHRFGELIWYKR